MLSKKMEQLLNEQINHEFYSAYLYLAMSAYLDDQGLKGAASWFYVQYQEETDHARYFYRYLLNVGGKVQFPSIPAPETDFSSLQDVLERTLAHERKVTALINNLACVARDEGDFKTSQFLLWFVSEQVEEETNCEDNMKKLKLAGEANLFLVDQDLGQRVYTASANPPVTL